MTGYTVTRRRQIFFLLLSMLVAVVGVGCAHVVRPDGIEYKYNIGSDTAAEARGEAKSGQMWEEDIDGNGKKDSIAWYSYPPNLRSTIAIWWDTPANERQGRDPDLILPHKAKHFVLADVDDDEELDMIITTHEAVLLYYGGHKFRQNPENTVQQLFTWTSTTQAVEKPARFSVEVLGIYLEKSTDQKNKGEINIVIRIMYQDQQEEFPRGYRDIVYPGPHFAYHTYR